jgi:HK97 family phage major capsid protein
MKLSDRIVKEAERLGPMRAQLKELETQLSQITESYDPEDDDSDEKTIAQIEELTQKINELRPKVEDGDKRLKALRDAENELATKAAPAPTGNRSPQILKGQFKDPSQNHQPGDFFVKMHLIKAVSHLTRQPESDVIEQYYKDDTNMRSVYGWLTKTAVMPADTTTTGWAAELVENDMRGFLASLAPRSIGAGLATRSLQLSFGGAASITIPRMNNLPNTGLTEPAWVGEGGVIPLQKFSFGSATINRYKLASIVPLTMELVEQSVPQAEQVLQRGMQEAYQIMLDNAILYQATAGPPITSPAVAGVRPAGILDGVTPIAADATGGYASVVADMQAMMGALTSARLGENPVLLMNDQDFTKIGMLMNPLGQLMFRDEIAANRLMGVDVLHSSTVPKGDVILLDAGALATAFDGPQVRISQEATLTMANADGTAPTQAQDAAGAVGTAGQVGPDLGQHVAGDGQPIGAAGAGYVAMSMFQTYSEAIRGIWPTSWVFLRPGAVAHITGINW